MNCAQHLSRGSLYVVLSLLVAGILPFSSAAQNWQNMPGQAKRIAAGGDSTVHVWSIGQENKVYKWKADAFTWQDFGGKADRVTVRDDGTPWVVNDLQVYRLRSRNWQNMPGKAQDIAAGGGAVWVIGENDEVYKWNDSAFSWQNFGGEADEIAVDAEGTPWVINDGPQGRQVYRLR